MAHKALPALFAGCMMAAACMTGTSAAANTAQLTLNGKITARCDFTSLPGNGALNELTNGQVHNIGDLGFTCNLSNGSAVHLTLKSQYGALQRDGGTEKIAYDLAWDILAPNDFAPAANYTSPQNITLTAGATGVEKSAPYRIRITGNTAMALEGTYRDVITYTISP